MQNLYRVSKLCLKNLVGRTIVGMSIQIRHPLDIMESIQRNCVTLDEI